MKRRYLCIFLIMTVLMFASCTQTSERGNSPDSVTQSGEVSDSTSDDGRSDSSDKESDNSQKPVENPSSDSTAAGNEETLANLNWITVDPDEKQPERSIDELIESLSNGLFPDGSQNVQDPQNTDNTQSTGNESIGSERTENDSNESESSDDDLATSVISTVTFSDEPWEEKSVEFADMSEFMSEDELAEYNEYMENGGQMDMSDISEDIYGEDFNIEEYLNDLYGSDYGDWGYGDFSGSGDDPASGSVTWPEKLPALPSNFVITNTLNNGNSYSFFIDYNSVTFDDVKAYVDTLKAAGFNIDPIERIDEEQPLYTYMAYHSNGDELVFNYMKDFYIDYYFTN